MNPGDPFPSTDATWMHGELAAGEDRRRALRSVVMARYFEPLRVYVKGSSFRDIGESAELVSAFFVSRFARDDYLDAWQQSGMTLRRWLVNGLILSIREEIRRRKRAARRGSQNVRDASGNGRRNSMPTDADGEPIDLLDWVESPEPEAVIAFERAWALSILREACEEVETICRADGEEAMWVLFRRHFIDGIHYAALVEETGFEPARAAVVARTVANRVRASLRRLISRDGIPADEVEDELRRVATLMARHD